MGFIDWFFEPLIEIGKTYKESKESVWDELYKESRRPQIVVEETSKEDYYKALNLNPE